MRSLDSFHNSSSIFKYNFSVFVFVFIKRVNKFDKKRKIKFNIIENCILFNHPEEQLCNNFLFRMSEDNDHENQNHTSRIQQNNKQTPKQEFKLPKLSMPPSRGRLMSRKENKAPTCLPSIHDDAQSDRNFRNTDTIHVSRTDNDIIRSEQQHTVRDQFALEMEQKLKMLMGQEQNSTNEQHPQSQHQQESDHLSDDLEFQQKILQNKEIIKMHRKNNQLPHKKLSKPLQALERLTQNSNKLKYNSKPQSNYERKMKDYTLSLQNKFLQRKKQSLGIIPEKPQKPMQRAKSKKILSLKDATSQEAKLNFGYKQFKANTGGNDAISKAQPRQPSKPLNPMNINKSYKQHQPPSLVQKPQKLFIKQTHKTEQPPSPSRRINKTSVLFDNIHSFLQNPIASQKHQKLYKELYKKLKAKSIPQLEEKIKELNKEMGIDENYETQQSMRKEHQASTQVLLTQTPMERTVRDWKRIDIKDKHTINYKHSDFEKELDYISYLQEKNSTSLSKFVDQQKIMVELQIHRRISKSIGKDNTHPENKQTKSQHAELRQSSKTAQEST